MWSRALQAIKNKKNLSLLCNTENDYNSKSADINKSDNMKFNTLKLGNTYEFLWRMIYTCIINTLGCSVQIRIQYLLTSFYHFLKDFEEEVVFTSFVSWLQALISWYSTAVIVCTYRIYNKELSNLYCIKYVVIWMLGLHYIDWLFRMWIFV